MTTDVTREALAAYAHEAWSGWMRHMFKLGQYNQDGSVTIPLHLVIRWKYQAATQYEKLPETMKERDRKEAVKMMVIVQRTKGD